MDPQQEIHNFKISLLIATVCAHKKRSVPPK